MKEFIEKKQVYFGSEITQCMRMDAIKKDGSREFICGIDIYRTDDDTFLVTSINGIYGRTFLDFVIHFDMYMKDSYRAIPDDCNYIIFSDDSEGIMDEISYIRDYEKLVFDLPKSVRIASNL